MHTIGRGELVDMLRGAARAIEEGRDRLSQLDSFGGDGDHGTTMARAMRTMEGAIQTAVGEASDIQRLLHDVGWAILGVDGGAAGPLFGAFFTGMAESAAGRTTLDAPELAAAFEAGLAGIRKYTKAQVGDKTMLDALVPAVEALRRAVDEGSDIESALRQAAEAARQGAEATCGQQARYGRAKNLGEKSIGTPDPGAASVALMFQGFLQGGCLHA